MKWPDTFDCIFDSAILILSSLASQLICDPHWPTTSIKESVLSPDQVG